MSQLKGLDALAAHIKETVDHNQKNAKKDFVFPMVDIGDGYYPDELQNIVCRFNDGSVHFCYFVYYGKPDERKVGVFSLVTLRNIPTSKDYHPVAWMIPNETILDMFNISEAERNEY